ncbi:hypothetical protein NTE_00651 [Candidatus Nitrososphaera evergladensis SR1]|jgi:L-asparagine transporter-like permease|uniref:Uncharacterized protein n=1 Tax=Candidatus Nitrososphaera evergladensis SR1 TaxID=1459636 RepID=A0A075MMS5_9ARCH|nr:hypothetical protein NTE_00651 [Candidatus Nitrososphaera evergladensis SR1]
MFYLFTCIYTHIVNLIYSYSQFQTLKSLAVAALTVILGVLLFSQLHFKNAEAKTLYSSDLGQTYAVFTMIAIAIAGFAIFLAIYTRESMAVKQS